MADLVWRVIVNNGTTPMYFWNQIKATRFASDHGIYTPPVQVPRPDGQPVN